MLYTDEELVCMEAQMRVEFKHSALKGEMSAPAPWAPRVDEPNRATGWKFKRFQSVGEVMTDSLDYTNGPSLIDVLALLSAAAVGQNIQGRAINLIEQMATQYARFNTEAS